MFSKIKNLIIFFYQSIEEKKKKYLKFLIILMTISSFLEFLSIGSVIPLISTFLTSDFENGTNYIAKIVQNNFVSEENFKKSIIILFIILIFMSSIFRLLVLRTTLRLTALISSDLGSKIFKNTINQTYQSIINQNSNVLISGSTEKMNRIHGIILSLLNFFSGIIISFGILVALLVYNFYLTIILITAFLILYLTIAKTSKFFLKINSSIVSKLSDFRVKFIQESIGSIRDIILDSSHTVYSKLYSNAEKKFRIAAANIDLIAAFPKIVLEGLGIILLLTLSSIFFKDDAGSDANLIVSLGVFAFAANKMLPLFHAIFQAWVVLIGNVNILDDLKSLLKRSNDKSNEISKSTKIKSFNKVTFKNLTFSYKKSKKNIFSDANFSFEFKKKIGVVGETGKGKSTFVDLFMGLLSPSSGKIFIDNEELNSTIVHDWQSKLSHVPQNIFLFKRLSKKKYFFWYQ